MLKWVSVSKDPCPSCAALHDHIHSAEDWERFGVTPKDHRLYCKDACTCHTEETEEEERGDLSTVPLRQRMKGGKLPNPRNNEERFEAFSAAPAKNANGYEVLVIREGQANGWRFSKTVLQDAVKMWNGVDCFSDHNVYNESVHNLAGVFSNPRWDETQSGIVADLRPTGPAADLLRMYAEEMLSEQETHPGMGFSPVLIFTAKGEDVENILRVRSVDMVINPAFQTKFMAQFQRSTMTPTNPPAPEGAEVLAAMRDITGASAEIKAEVESAKAIHLAACQDLLETSLNAQVELPEQATKLIRERFSGKAFKPAELQAEIKSFREAFAAQNAGAAIAGPAQITGMFSSEDQLQAAFDDLFEAPREAGAESLKTHRFSGIKEAYMLLTKDYDLVGHAEVTGKFQGTAATFPKLTANALNKAIVKHWNQFGAAGYNWWEKIATVEQFENLQEVKWLRLGTIASLPSVAEGAEYTELKLGDNGESSSFTKYGGYISFTLEAIDKDDTRKLRAAPRELALAAIRNISEQVAAIFTSGSGAGPTLADGGALFNATAATTAGGHANLLTTALGTDYTAWNAAAAAVYNQPMIVANEAGYYGAGKKQAIDPSIILVPRALKVQAETLFVPRWEAQAQNVANVNVTWGGRVDVVTVPEWTDATDWAAVVDPKIIPGIMIGTRYGVIPQIVLAGDQKDPAMFSNDESRLKVRHFLTVGIGNWSALHKNNVA